MVVRKFIYWLVHLSKGQLAALLGGGALASALMFFALTRYTTHTRTFCLTCHQYQRAHFDAKSAVHPTSVACVECHAAHSKLVAGRFVSAKHASLRVNCLRCHAEVQDRDPSFKFNVRNVRINHPLHVNKLQMSCADCHYTVAHDRRPNPTNRPPMDGCLQSCHKEKERECRICHPKGTIEAPTTPVSASGKECVRCHRDFQAHLVSFGGAKFSHAPHLANNLRCNQCHSNQPQHGVMTLNRSSCQSDCHTKKMPASHKLVWKERHGTAYLSRMSECNQCHTQKFCSDCHGLNMPHPDDWVRAHGARLLSYGSMGVWEYGSVRSNTSIPPYSHTSIPPYSVCSRCHTAETCQNCHATHKPASHLNDWRRHHGRRDTRNCATCHATDFCRTCHASGKPTSHTADWLKQHGKASRREGDGCTTCHSSNFCIACHKVEMPHPQAWKNTLHQSAAKRSAANCSSCHAQNECVACHQKHRPTSHTKEWKKEHSATSASSKTSCAVCHSADGCSKCHQEQYRHPKNWLTVHKQSASFHPTSQCFRCHQRADCRQCHEEPGETK